MKTVSAETLFELGKLYSEKGAFLTSVEHLQQANQIYLKQKNLDAYLDGLNLMLRAYAELGDDKSIHRIKENFQDLVIHENINLNSKSYYTLGICAEYKGQYETALEYFEKSLALALQKDNKKEICYAINGLANVYAYLGRYEDALKEIYNLQVFFQVIKLPEVELVSQFTNGFILRLTKKYPQSLKIYWKCYDILKDQKNLYLYIYLLYSMGLTYFESGDSNMACVYLTLAWKTVDPKNQKRLAGRIEEKLKLVGNTSDIQYDIIFDTVASAVIECKKGKINFKNQFILLDMLRLFLSHPGQSFSKEDLVQKVWKQDYDPSTHDNKIYVTIKRLRKMIEPEYDKPKYIFRAKNGYYLNKNARILME